ncbi:MAG: inner membrane-spanning protein YciB [Gammaproteobacteria bacterium]
MITWLVKRKVGNMLLASAALIVGLGGISLLLNNDLFSSGKPTVLNWVFAVVFLGSQYVGNRPIAQRILDSVGKGEFRLQPADWQRLNLMWVGFFMLAGAANIYVAYSFSETTWVNFKKLFGLTRMTVVFAIVQGIWINRRSVEES